MATKLRTRITAQDIDRLTDAHRILVQLTTGLHPSARGHAPLYAALWSVKGCAIEWSGDPTILATANARTVD